VKGADGTMERKKIFNITGLCVPELHYMVDITEKIHLICRKYIDQGAYFTINRARQYGKTTTLRTLEHALREQYIVIRISFEGKEEYFSSLQALAGGLFLSFRKALQYNHPEYADVFSAPVNSQYPMVDLCDRIQTFCQTAKLPTVLMIDEVDKAADNQTFLSLLGVLREMYLNKIDYRAPAFDSVILAGVHDIKNLKMKLRPEEGHNYNSPWNIAAEFDVDMSFSVRDIAGMLAEYENDYHTGMDIRQVSRTIYDYTSGYPYLVSYLCKLMDEAIPKTGRFSDQSKIWTSDGVAEAAKEMMKKSNTLFDDMKKKLSDYPELRNMLYAILFNGRSFPYNPDNQSTDIGTMFGFLKEKDGQVCVANRIFETRMYNYFLSDELIGQTAKAQPAYDRNQFIENGFLDMDLVMRKFYEYFTDVYQESDTRFLEENGRRLFLLYLKPIINGVGNYYVEARTRDMKRTDVIVDYLGHQSVIEMKIYHGEEYNRRGRKQLAEYLDFYHLDKGYLLSFNFNKKKKTGVQNISYDGKTILEVMV